MEINRHNCEEWFLLYVDDELDASGRRQVEEFVADHPDTAVLLEGFSKARLKPDSILRFNGKKDLMKKADESFTNPLPETEKEMLLIMADGEATSEERKSFKERLTTDAVLRSEWELVCRTRMQPDPSVKYPDRASLHRKESGIRLLGWFSVSAAASLLLFLGLRIWPPSTGMTNETPTTDVSVAEALPNAPEAEEEGAHTRKATENKSSEPVQMAMSKSAEKKEPIPIKTPASTESGSQPAVAATETTPEEVLFQSLTERSDAPESMVSIESKKPPATEYTPTDRGTASQEASLTAMNEVKTDFATMALIEEATEPAPHAIRKTILARSGLKEAARKADRYYQKITNPSIEPRPLEVKWTSNRN